VRQVTGIRGPGRSRAFGTRGSFAVAVAAALLAGLAHAEDVPRIPLRVGLSIVTAVHESDGDYESIKVLESEDADAVLVRYSSEEPLDSDVLDPADQYTQYRPHPADPQKVIRTLTVHRSVLRADLKSSDHYLRVFAPPPAVSERVPGTTAIGTSARVLNALKAGGAVEFTTYLAAFDAAPITSADATEGAMLDPRCRGTLRRVEKGSVGVPVIVNGALVDLPAIHVKGVLLDSQAEFWFLDDPGNPLTLRFRFDKDRLDVIRINFPGDSEVVAGADAPTGIEQSLSKTGHADIYGIYFGFNSDVIRPESEPVLKEIASLLGRHPDWKLAVDGHTDNIGGAVANQALSTRRAAAVKKALVQRYHVAPDRLDTAGYGPSRPKATNDTLEGRALNRRVELVRE
jgi:flagellar motor protein MotB